MGVGINFLRRIDYAQAFKHSNFPPKKTYLYPHTPHHAGKTITTMPLAQPIAALRQELNKLLADDDLPAGLKLCKGLLPENGEKFKLILAMQAQLQLLNKENIKGKITQEEYARRLAIIVDAFITFVAELETLDFDPPAIDPDADAQNGAQTGHVLYRVPHSMALGKASICTIRVAIDEDAILEDIIIDKDTRLKEKIEVSERMSAEILGTESEAFDILALNAKDQRVHPTGYTQWLFRVTPLLEGEHLLLVKVSLLEFDPNTKEYVPRDVSVLETVVVASAPQHSDEEEVPLKSVGKSFVVGQKVDKKPNINIDIGTFNPALEITGATELNLDDLSDILIPIVKNSGKKETKTGAQPSPKSPTHSAHSDPFHKEMVLVKGSDFYLSQSAVTFAQWRAVMGSNASSFDGCDQCSIEHINWEDIQAFLKTLNAQTGRQYRLPTEAEWEYAVSVGYQNNLGFRLAL
ncbi:Sulphatase-modifying factor protein [Haliscomenobacter hydrossis DSM 1100]|uniref:Sulphatase-modifying factor protein n=2 Tax=Haliscomenobacter TaxID=2349 RepID=F4L2T4_HALH1|nr:Sulphatase-modifying factor protein [Haliscomenobacter hydrossis DSM 1100]